MAPLHQQDIPGRALQLRRSQLQLERSLCREPRAAILRAGQHHALLRVHRRTVHGVPLDHLTRLVRLLVQPITVQRGDRRVMDDGRYTRVDRHGSRCVRRRVWCGTLIALPTRPFSWEVGNSFSPPPRLFLCDTRDSGTRLFELIGQQIV